jgi:SAM-dependent methyltransferase
VLGSLNRRPRGRALARVLQRATGGRVAAPGPPPAWPSTRREGLDLLRREPPPGPPPQSEATAELDSRLSPDDLAALGERLSDGERALLESATEEHRRQVTLSLAVHHGITGATGLSTAEPPADVHATSRGPLAAGGGYHHADLVLEALRRGGLDPGAQRRGLDFGCSSGRVVRVLHAVLPDVEWHACDPNAGAIEWASEALPGISFFVSPQEPPLRFEDGTFDFAYAISIWSHFGEGAALRWLGEMHRLIRPGGLLVITTHGFHSLAYFGGRGLWPLQRLQPVAQELYTRGFAYRDVFGEQGDFGVKSPEWGMAFLTPEWLLARSTPEWAVAWHAPGRVEENQDVYVLIRR